MSNTENLYQASSAQLPAYVRLSAPRVVKVAVGLYVLSFLTKVSRALLIGLDVPVLSIPAWLLIAGFVGGISWALLRGMQWARMWIAFLTLLPVVVLVTQTPWEQPFPHDWLLMTGITARIAVGVMMFLTSARAWFAQEHGAKSGAQLVRWAQ